MSIIKYVTLQKIVAHDFQYDPRVSAYIRIRICTVWIHVLAVTAFFRNSCSVTVMKWLYKVTLKAGATKI